jgi:hypothetical protein
VIDLERALAGQKTPEIMRIPRQIGQWGITASPDRRFIVAGNRESRRAPFEGNTFLIIDLDVIGPAPFLSPSEYFLLVGWIVG